jgi:hypothetical protein
MATGNEITQKGDLDLRAALEDYIKRGKGKDVLEKDSFIFAEAREAFKKFKEFGKTKPISFFEQEKKKFEDSKKTFKEFLPEEYCKPSLNAASEEYRIFEFIGRLVAYFDTLGYNKKIWNPDKPCIANSGVYAKDWVRTLLDYKIFDCNIAKLKAPSIKNALIYIEDPNKGITILSDAQRKQFSENVFNKKYIPDQFMEHLLDYFKDVVVPVKCKENRTSYISTFICDKAIKPIWFDSKEKPSKDKDKTVLVINENTSEKNTIRRNTIFYGPPGTGKTYKLNDIKRKEFDGRSKFVIFHPSYSYEDFVEGIKPVLRVSKADAVQYELVEGNIKPVHGVSKADAVQYELVDGIFKGICIDASKDPGNDYAIFIDEINRGNIPSIFGELIALIEDEKRGGFEGELSTELPYSKEPFKVPPNLYIYGTMNTADRSVEALDIALRRRFVFEEFVPDSSLIECKYENTVVIKIFETINQRIEVLLGKDYRIGHSYFMEDKVANLDGLKAVFLNEIIPLLKEYFYEDWEKLCLVLGQKFVEKSVSKVKFCTGHEDSYGDYQDKNIYGISNPKDWDIETFKSILED